MCFTEQYQVKTNIPASIYYMDTFILSNMKISVLNPTMRFKKILFNMFFYILYYFNYFNSYTIFTISYLI